ncbi:PREDICTED: LOB domain-containing protein 28-like [Camelina sativa]|uniref:LOB domain-containing protein 28-like n=1 Tax=Camelina sativa TaxID=90675 RepID=A0ABM0YXD0_CAMSA|nr:PREDICTED: LOB domain-containing protein 28-like [Camelina sativa]
MLNWDFLILYNQMDKGNTITPPCAACKYLRRKCTKDCVFAPYFPTNKQESYEMVHKVFGASHVASLINEIPPSHRDFAMSTLAWEAQLRHIDPIHGVNSILDPLQYQLKDLQNQIAIAKNELSSSFGMVPKFVPPPPITYQQRIHPNPMIPDTTNNDGCLTAQQLRDEAKRFASTQPAQFQQTQETQTQYNESVMIVRDKKI